MHLSPLEHELLVSIEIVPGQKRRRKAGEPACSVEASLAGCGSGLLTLGETPNMKADDGVLCRA